MYSTTQVNGKCEYPPPQGQGHGYPSVAQGQPYPPHLHISAASSGWSTGLSHCCDDPANCLITSVCPCVTFGQVAEIVNKGTTPCGISGAAYALLGLTGLPCLLSCFYRSKMRGQYDLEEGPCADCLVHFCCEPCALCQEYRELRNRGFDMGIGWQANMDRQSRGITIPPVRGNGMTR